MPESSPALQVEELRVSFLPHGTRGGCRPSIAVRGVSLAVAPRECLGIVGESGSGKTQLFLAALGLLPPRSVATGRVRFEGADILGEPPDRLNLVRGSRVSMIFQDPMTALTPHMRIGAQIAESLVHHAGASWRDAEREALRMLERVSVPEAGRRMRQYPHELSGGLRQRVTIGMSLICGPALLIADEPTTALDVTVQAQIIELLRSMRSEVGMSLVLISHDLAVVGQLAERIAVMYAGRIVECGPARQILHAPRHPYTAGLLACTPDLTRPLAARMPTLGGQPPGPAEEIRGCAFAPRCPRAAERCGVERPQLESRTSAGGAEAAVACHFPLLP
ncbi:MAG TPA: ABC transporter ATP-binding protein [Steroidobacteraceae bacterium]|nr:ABC transporter ATP-binding protein [Steroidobacteraceae bacterium]